MGANERQVRIAANETRFREINETLLEGLSQLPDDPRPVAFICECGMRTCEATVLVSTHEYEAVRADPRRFVIVAGHEFPEAERVVLSNERFVVVEKHEDVAAIVEASDPRAAERSGRGR